MSQEALVAGTVSYLRDALDLEARECGEQLDGQPPPDAGQRYVAVHEGEWSNSSDLAYDESFGLQVTVTLRTPYAPKDRTHTVLESMRALCAGVRRALHMNYSAMAAWNGLIDPDAEGFAVPLMFESCTAARPAGPDWFYGEGMATPPSGLTRTLTFGRANRVQPIEGAD